jgi:dipeptidyl aminopeptidase/acylaminoacyl peptidase
MKDKTRARGDRDIVYSGKHFRFSGKFFQYSDDDPKIEQLEDADTFGLYRINPDGTRPTRIAHLRGANDTAPHWSPDGRSILFVRRLATGEERVCRCDAEGHAVRTLFRLPKGKKRIVTAEWLPDGRSVLVALNIGKYESKRELVHVEAVWGLPLRTISGGTDYRLSPDGRHVILLDEIEYTATLVELSTGKRMVLGEGKWGYADMSWYSADTLLARCGSMEKGAVWGYGALDLKGHFKQKPILLDPTKSEWEEESTRNADEGAFLGDLTWHRLPRDKNRLLINSFNHRSDGGYFDVFLAELWTGKAWFLHRGQLLAVSPNGAQCLTATMDWVGPYKEFRGGRRCGPLEVVSTDLAPGKRPRPSRWLTPRLMAFSGADWR